MLILFLASDSFAGSEDNNHLKIPFQKNGQIDSLDNYKGKFILVKFWATWCGYCQQQMPVFSLLKQRYSNNENIEFLPISIDFKGSRLVKKYFEQENINNFDILTDQRNTLFKSFSLRGIPALLLISKNGKILKKYNSISQINIDYLDNLVK